MILTPQSPAAESSNGGSSLLKLRKGAKVVVRLEVEKNSVWAKLIVPSLLSCQHGSAAASWDWQVPPIQTIESAFQMAGERILATRQR